MGGKARSLKDTFASQTLPVATLRLGPVEEHVEGLSNKNVFVGGFP